jgi:hypothetical protein
MDREPTTQVPTGRVLSKWQAYVAAASITVAFWIVVSLALAAFWLMYEPGSIPEEGPAAVITAVFYGSWSVGGLVAFGIGVILGMRWARLAGWRSWLLVIAASVILALVVSVLHYSVGHRFPIGYGVYIGFVVSAVIVLWRSRRPTLEDSLPAPAPPQPSGQQPRFPDAGSWPPAGYRSAGTRAKVAQWAHALTALISLVMVVIVVQIFDMLDRADRFQLTEREVDDWLARIESVSAIAVWGALISFISLVTWLSRSVDNTPSLGGGIARRGPRWAIGAWFIPIANVVMPALIIRDLARRIGPECQGRGVLVLVWWLCYWGPAIMGFYVGFLPILGTDSVREIYIWVAGANTVSALGYLVTFYLVRVLQRDADYWHARLRADWQAAADAELERRRAAAAVPALETSIAVNASER